MGIVATSLFVGAFPKSLPVVAFARIVGNSANAVSGSTTTLAAIADICDGDHEMMTASMALFGAFAGLGVIVGPAIGGAVLAATQSPSAVYTTKAMWSLMHLVWMKRNFCETLTEERRQRFARRLVNPFNFASLFTRTPMLRDVTIFNILQCAAEGKCINDLNQIWMKGELSWSIPQTARWTVSYGIMMVLGGILSKALIPKVGPRTWVSSSSFCGMIAMLMYGSIRKGWAYNLGLLINCPSVNAMGAAPIKGAGTKHAALAGMGMGEYSAAFANLRALVYVTLPLLYTRLYASRTSQGKNPGIVYFLIALLAFVIPEFALHRKWTDKQLFPQQ